MGTKRNSARRDRYRARWRATGANCHICGESIDYTIPWPDPRSFVVDHVKPLARGGTDTFSNTAPAHATCNSTKRARDVAPIIRRSGALS